MIQLTDTLAVTADSECYIVGKPRQRAGRGIEMQGPRYYSTMSQAVRGAVSATLRQKVATNEISTLEEFLQQEKALQENFTTQLKPLEH